MQSNNMTTFNQSVIDQGQLLEKVILGNDISSLTSLEKVEHVKNICKSLNLNPLTRPIQIIKFQGKEIPYFAKDATEQLRKNNKISITKLDTKIMDGLCIVTAYASAPDGRTDSSTGVVTIKSLQGEALANAMLKAETKAKRRVTLSICGLGLMDECEADSLRTLGAKKVEFYNNDPVVEAIQEVRHMDELKLDLANVSNMEELKSWFTKAKSIAKTKDETTQIIEMKDTKKFQLELDNAEMITVVN